MNMKLMIVESPAKAKKIAEYLGDGWRVEACMGHIRDLPETELGVSVENAFQPSYEVLQGKSNLVRRLIKAARDAEVVYLATDPDREGEAIAWHLLEMMRPPQSKSVFRVTFNALTKDAVQTAVAAPRNLDIALVEAQQARRIVDRLVGYLVSPLACKALDGRYSAGRVQSVCLRLIVEREQEISSFVAYPYWNVSVMLAANGVEFEAKIHRIKGGELPFKTREPADKLMVLLQQAQYWVYKTKENEKLRHPLPPFTTSSLQQAAAKGLGLSPERTMELAQRLYEAGQITYMRTDGVSVAPEAQIATREHITREYGRDYLPEEPPSYKTKATNAQEAHECIRPTEIHRLPQATDGDGVALYALIWKRFIASQMAAARFGVNVSFILAGKTTDKPYPLELRAQGRKLVFEGFLKVYQEPSDEGDESENVDDVLPPLQEAQVLHLIAPHLDEGQTRAQSRYTEAALIQELEQRGIGRPSTYAGMVRHMRQSPEFAPPAPV